MINEEKWIAECREEWEKIKGSFTGPSYEYLQGYLAGRRKGRENKEHAFVIADRIIERTYPDIFKKGRGWWGEQRIPNYGILRCLIAAEIFNDRKVK